MSTRPRICGRPGTRRRVEGTMQKGSGRGTPGSPEGVPRKVAAVTRPWPGAAEGRGGARGAGAVRREAEPDTGGPNAACGRTVRPGIGGPRDARRGGGGAPAERGGGYGGHLARDGGARGGYFVRGSGAEHLGVGLAGGGDRTRQGAWGGAGGDGFPSPRPDGRRLLESGAPGVRGARVW